VTSAPSKPRTLRFHLTSLVCVSVVPLLIFAVIIAALLEKQQRTSLDRSFRDTVRALTVAVDHELTSSIGHLEDVRHTLDTDEPAISNLFTGLVLKVPTVGFTVPVRRRGILQYALGARLDVGKLSLLLSEGQLPPG